MIVGYILIGTFAGLIAFAVALFLGASFWLAFGLYSLVGTIAMIVPPLAISLASWAFPSLRSSADERVTDNQADASTDYQGATGYLPMRILAVDDDPFILDLIPMIASRAGFTEVTPARSGKEALALLANDGMAFDCLMVDINMPQMDGIELCRRVRKMSRYARTPIIMLSAMRDIHNMKNAFLAGASDYVTKPFEIDEVGTRMRSAQETLVSRRQVQVRAQDNTNNRERAGASFAPERSGQSRSGNTRSLVDRRALSNYLTQLPPNERSSVQVFAISLVSDGDTGAQWSVQSPGFLEIVSDAMSDRFGCDQTVMAFTDNTMLVIAAVSNSIPDPAAIETEIAKRIEASAIDRTPALIIAVGGAVGLRGDRAQRGRNAIDHAIALAEAKAFGSQPLTATHLFKS